MSTDTRQKPSSELSAALATRIRSQLSLAHGLAALEDLPSALRAQVKALAARVRRALDVPSHGEIAELSRRVEALAEKLDALEDEPAQPGPSAASVRDELRAEIRAVADEARGAAAAAREAAAHRTEAAAREAAAHGPEAPATAEARASGAKSSGKKAGGGKAGGTKSAKSSSKGSGKNRTSKSSGGAGQTQKKTRTEAVANKTSRKTSS